MKLLLIYTNNVSLSPAQALLSSHLFEYFNRSVLLDLTKPKSCLGALYLQKCCFSMNPCTNSSINHAIRTWWRLDLHHFVFSAVLVVHLFVVDYFVSMMAICRLIHNNWIPDILMSNSYIIQKPLKMTPLFAIQCAVRHAFFKFAYSYAEMQCIIATHYFVKVSKF